MYPNTSVPATQATYTFDCPKLHFFSDQKVSSDWKLIKIELMEEASL